MVRLEGDSVVEDLEVVEVLLMLEHMGVVLGEVRQFTPFSSLFAISQKVYGVAGGILSQG